MSQSESEWDWMVAMAKASNSGDKQAVSPVCDAPLAEIPRLQHVTVSVFEITKENVALTPVAAERLAELEDDGRVLRLPSQPNKRAVLYVIEWVGSWVALVLYAKEPRTREWRKPIQSVRKRHKDRERYPLRP